MYPTHLRGTGESFAANVGGRMIGTSSALVTTHAGDVDAGRVTRRPSSPIAAALVGIAVYVVGFIASFWLPEPTQEDLPD